VPATSPTRASARTPVTVGLGPTRAETPAKVWVLAKAWPAARAWTPMIAWTLSTTGSPKMDI
jgi:hypothetical protein